MSKPPDLKDIDEDIEKLNKEKEDAVANQDFEKAASLRDKADKLRKKEAEGVVKDAFSALWAADRCDAFGAPTRYD